MSPEQFLLFAGPWPEPTLLVSGGGRVLAANGAVEARLGVPVAALVGRGLAEITEGPAEELAGYLRLCSRSRSPVLGAVRLRGGDACRAEGAVVAPAGEGGEALVMVRLLPSRPAVEQFLLLNQRIEELAREADRRRRAEEAARQEGERLRVTLRSIGDAVIVTDVAGRVTMMNPVAEGLTGWGWEEGAGRPLEEVFRIVNETTREPVESPAARALREGSAVGLANHAVLIGRGGAERPIDDSAAPIRDGRGEVVGAVLVFRDLSARRLAELRVQQSEQMFRTLAESIPQLAWAARPDGHIYWYNRRWYEYTGTTPEQMEGWGWRSAHDPEVLPRVLERWRASLEGGTPFDMVFPLRGADGLFRPFLTRVMPLKDEAGRVLQWFGTNTDISEQREMEEALREAARRKDEFLAVLAHEIRNPLAPIRNGLQVLRLAGDNRAMADQARAMMERQMHHLVRLVDELLDLSRITRGKIDLRKEVVSLADVVAGAMESCGQLVEDAGLELEVSLPERPVYVEADRTRLVQALCNLLSNSAKFTERGGRVWLSARREGADAVLSVRDTGAGIPREMLSRVFEMFVQLNRPLERARGGLGIGLAIVKRLAELHGGDVEARSEGEGAGSEFVVRLPAVGPEGRQQGPAREAAGAGRRRVLVVDDNVDAAESLALMLRLLGHEVRAAHDGLAGLEAAEAFRPEVMLLDIGMPGLDGHDVCRRLRALPWGRAVVVAALTGWGQEEDRRKSREAGFDHHLTKPVEPEALEAVLREAGRRGA